jgi:hypothetical protein
MTTDGGGWTLALKVNGNLGNLVNPPAPPPTFNYDAALWTNASTYQPQFPDLDRNEAKLQTFMSIGFTDILVGMEYPILTNGPVQLKTQKLTEGRRLAAGPVPGPVPRHRDRPQRLEGPHGPRGLAAAQLQPRGLQLGPQPERPGWPQVRVGIVSNQENDCNSPTRTSASAARASCAAAAPDTPSATTRPAPRQRRQEPPGLRRRVRPLILDAGPPGPAHGSGRERPAPSAWTPSRLGTARPPRFAGTIPACGPSCPSPPSSP